MIVSGSFQSPLADELQLQLDPKLMTRVSMENCASVLSETPEIFTYDLLLFCQGLGLCKCE